MAERNKYQEKFYSLIIGSLIFILLCYHLAFRRTISEISAYKENLVQLSSLDDAPVQLQILESKVKEFDKFFSSTISDNNNYQVLLLQKSTLMMKGTNIKIAELPRIIIEQDNGFTTKTQLIVYQGSFIDLLKFLHAMEKDKTVGNIGSVDFSSQKDYRSGIILLKMKVYFQIVTEDIKQ